MDELFELTVEELRTQRHDFMNYIQVIYGYIQIDRPNAAAEYIKKISSRMEILSKIFNLESSELGVLLHKIISVLYKFDIDVVFVNGIDYIDNVIFSKNINKVKLSLDIIKLKLENLLSENFSDTVFITVSGTAEVITIYISNTNEVNSNDENNKIIVTESTDTTDGYSLELLSKGKDFCFKLNYF